MNDGGLVIDTHVQPISADSARYPLANVVRWAERPITVEQILQTQEEAGVHGTVLVQSPALYGFDNTYFSDSARAHPGRCVAVCAIDLLAAEAPETLTFWVKERGVRGVRLTNPISFEDPKTFPVWERARELGVPVLVQLQAEHVESLGRTAARFTDIPVVLDHTANVNRSGLATPPETLLALAAYPRVFLKVTTRNLEGIEASKAAPETFLEPLIERFGNRRLIWGTDYPATADKPYGQQLTQAREAWRFVSDDDRRLIFGENALQLWPQLRPAGLAHHT